MYKQSNQAGRLCACGNEIRKGTKCDACYKRRWREANQERAVYNCLKSNAKRRGVGFFISFQEFVSFIVDTAYIRLRGTSADSLTIDRKDPRLGYRAGNLQILTLSENVKKYKRGEAWMPVKQSKEDAGTPF